MKSLLFIPVTCLLIFAGCGKKIEIDLDKSVDIPELSWELPEGWKAERTELQKIPWHFNGPDKAIISLMKLKDSDGFLSILGVTRAWRKTLDLKNQTKEELRNSLSYLKEDVIAYKVDNGVEAIYGAFYTLNSSLWVFRYSGRLKEMREENFDNIVKSVAPNEQFTVYIESLKEIDDPRAFAKLAAYYSSGTGVVRDVETAKKYLRKGRAAGDHDASLNLAVFAIEEKETDKAVEYLAEGVKAKHVASLKSLAGIVLDKNKDVEFAGQLLKDAADKGDVEAMYYLASLNLEVHPQKKKQETVILVNTAAHKGYSPAMVKLAEFYLTGYGLKVNNKKALDLFEQAAALKDRKAVEMLGHLYLSGEYFDKDLKKSLMYLFDAAALNSTKSMITLSSLYLKGEGVEKNTKVGFELLEQAVRGGDAQAMLVMGNMFYHGLYTVKDLTMAYKLFNQSALAGNKDGMYKAGQALLLGEGVERNQTEGVKWLKKAAAAGNEDAKKLLKGKKL